MGHQLYMDALTMPRPEVWQDRAACLGEDPVVFEIIDEDHVLGLGIGVNDRINLTNENFAIAEELCLSCPVMDACWKDSTPNDREWSYRAGRYPSRFTGVPRGRPVGSGGPDYVKEKRCNRGHVRLRTDVKCKVCNAINKQERREIAAKLAVDRAMKKL